VSVRLLSCRRVPLVDACRVLLWQPHHTFCVNLVHVHKLAKVFFSDGMMASVVDY
jgi:hypothetical protein